MRVYSWMSITLLYKTSSPGRWFGPDDPIIRRVRQQAQTPIDTNAWCQDTPAHCL